MRIDITRIKASIQKMDHADIKCLCSKYLDIDYQPLQSSTDNNRFTLEHLAPGKGKPCVFLTIDQVDDHKDSNVLLDLKRPFFKTATGFEIDKLLRFLNRYKHTVKQFDLTFVDDQRCLTVQEIVHWCKNSADYCVGSLVKWDAPQSVVHNEQISRIKLGNPKSKTNCGVISIAPHTGNIGITIKLRKREKIAYVLRDHCCVEDYRQFVTRCLELLVSSFDIITAQSKKNRIKSKYVRQKSWAAFLGNDVKNINWSDM